MPGLDQRLAQLARARARDARSLERAFSRRIASTARIVPEEPMQSPSRPAVGALDALQLDPGRRRAALLSRESTPSGEWSRE